MYPLHVDTKLPVTFTPVGFISVSVIQVESILLEIHMLHVFSAGLYVHKELYYIIICIDLTAIVEREKCVPKICVSYAK